MKPGRIFTLMFAGSVLLFAACSPVLNRSYMDAGDRSLSFTLMRENPEQFKGRLFILGGVVVLAKFTQDGSQIEALHVQVDQYGYFEDSGQSEGRYLAVLPQDKKTLDPVIYSKGRRITIAGEFIGIRKGRIDEMDYEYPVFLLRQIYLWPREKRREQPHYYYDPWFYPYPYYYRSPWWYYPHRYAPVPVQPQPMPRKPDQPDTLPKPAKDQEGKRGRDQK